MASGNDLRELEAYLDGWEASARTHGVTDSAVGFGRAFADFVHATKNWSTSAGWADAIAANVPTRDGALGAFFSLYRQYKATRGSRPAGRPGSLGLTAVGRHGQWFVEVEETTSGPDRWFLELSGPNLALSAEVDSPAYLATVYNFLARTRATTAYEHIAVGRIGRDVLAIRTDGETMDRYFLVIESNGGVALQYRLTPPDLDHVIAAWADALDDMT